MATLSQTLIMGANKIAQRFGYRLVKREMGQNLTDDLITIMGGANRDLVLFDVGANIGQTAERFARAFPRATIHAFEPYPPTVEQLIARTAAEPRIVVHPIGFGEADQAQSMFIAPKTVLNSLLPPATDAETQWRDQVTETSVSVRRLDSFCVEHGIAHIDLLKIDTEGYEDKVLAGAGAMLTPDTIRGVLVEIQFASVYAGQASLSQLFARLFERRYKLVDLYDQFRKSNPAMLWCNALFVA